MASTQPGATMSPFPRLSHRVLGLRLRHRRRAVAQRRPLVEPADDRARDLRSPFAERGRRPAVVPVPGVAGQAGQAIEHQGVAVAVDDGQERASGDRVEDAPVVGLAELGVDLLGVGRPAGRLDRVKDSRDPLGQRRIGEADQGLGDGLQRADRTSVGCSRRSAPRRPPDSLCARDSGEKRVGSTGASPMRRSKPMRMMVSICCDVAVGALRIEARGCASSRPASSRRTRRRRDGRRAAPPRPRRSPTPRRRSRRAA